MDNMGKGIDTSRDTADNITDVIISLVNKLSAECRSYRKQVEQLTVERDELKKKVEAIEYELQGWVNNWQHGKDRKEWENNW